MSGIGSSMSRPSLVDSAIARGLIVRSVEGGVRLLELSDQGAVFVSGLHPRTFDADLPFRLETWVLNDDYVPMRRYINAVFGRQLRYQRKQYRREHQ